MEPAIKKVVAALATALIVVIGVILWTGSAKKNAAVTTDIESINQHIDENRQTESGRPDAREKPLDGAHAGETGATSEAQPIDGAHEEDLYEGALAGLSDEEIANMAMAEEESAARTAMTGAEDAVD